MPASHHSNIVISNPHVDELKTFYTFMVWMMKEKRSKNNVFETHIELGEIVNIDSDIIKKITSETDITEDDLFKMAKHFLLDTTVLLNIPSIIEM